MTKKSSSALVWRSSLSTTWTGFKARGVICRVSFSPQKLLEAVENGDNAEITFESDDFVDEGKKYN